ncbi:DUF3667 domain-containing protein [Fulvivirgaceae bacterium BMA10]|uniref:DUF3667 domain-containing protein n=1 Tax=Splendidivirga corallicola TaxID=3051826 RepID=A0ABT8KXU5_9BACT|nr:DUF3667 domain-containing protein [Fulvivirgaceae bacterium BMA10]
MNEVQHCKSCNNQFQGRYCNQCGEKILDPKERTLKYFFGQFINAITFVDRKFLSGLYQLFFKPGFLASEYALGRRKKYIQPLSLFLIANLIYFFYMPFDGFNSRLISQMNYQQYSPMVQRMVEDKIQQEGISLEAYKIEYNRRSTNISKLMLVLLIPLFSLPLSLLFVKHRSLYADHFIFSIYFCSFYLYLMLGLSVVLQIAIGLFSLFEVDIGFLFADLPFGIAASILTLWYLTIAIKAFYGGKTYVNILKALVLIAAQFYIFLGYRFLLFLVTFWSG